MTTCRRSASDGDLDPLHRQEVTAHPLLNEAGPTPIRGRREPVGLRASPSTPPAVPMGGGRRHGRRNPTSP